MRVQHAARVAPEEAVFRPALPSCPLPGITEMQMNENDMGSEPKRQPLSKRTRFDVFKRDGFVCQYCGAHPPTVVLHVDHVVPVAEGGKNDIDNLVTACESCNLGKSDVPLSVVPQSLSAKAEEVAEREAQLLGYQQIFEAKRQRLDDETWRVLDVLFPAGQPVLRDHFNGTRRFIEALGVHAVIEAAEFTISNRSVRPSNEFRYFCGICWNRIREGGCL